MRLMVYSMFVYGAGFLSCAAWVMRMNGCSKDAKVVLGCGSLALVGAIVLLIVN